MTSPARAARTGAPPRLRTGAPDAVQRARRRVGDRTTNRALAVLLTSALVTGVLANTLGTPATRAVVIAHGVAGIGLLVLSPRKTRIAAGSLSRPRRRPGSTTSLLLAGCALVVVATGLVHATGAVQLPGPVSLMQLHVATAFLLAPLALNHARARRSRPRRVRAAPLAPSTPTLTPTPVPTPVPTPLPTPLPTPGDLQRRALLRVAATTAGAALAWQGWEAGLRATGAPGATRRFTGSLRLAAGDPAAMPVTSWLDDAVPTLDPTTWALRTGVRTLSLPALTALVADRGQDVQAALDCTSAWSSAQTWIGIRLDHLLDHQLGAAALRGARSIAVRSSTGYTRHLPVPDARNLYLATAVAGAPLSPGHGYPARLVAPGRRGFWWVKWVSEVSASPTPWWAQPPFPLT